MVNPLKELARTELAGWVVLGLLLLATLVGALLVDRAGWPGWLGDEATYLAAAQSLAWELDLSHTASDQQRFVGLWERPPEGLILQTTDGGASYSYGKPFFYPLFLAPFVRLAPWAGPPLANALLLALAAVLAALSLRRRIGEAAPLWVATLVFASVTFAHVFWAHADLFLMCLTAIALALATGDPSGDPTADRRLRELPDMWHDPTGRSARLYWGRWLTVGALLAIVAISRPPYAALLLPVALAVPKRRRQVGLTALIAGAVGLLLLTGAINLISRGSASSYAGERQGYYSGTGFPTGAGAVQEAENAAPPDGGSWLDGEALSLVPEGRLTAWNLLYFAAGRHVGLLPYFLPLLLGVALFRPGGGRWALLAAVLLAAAAFFWLRPFNFYGGGGSLANRYFLPLYPAFWFLAARPPRFGWLSCALITAAAAPFLLPLWSAPLAYPLAPEGGFRYASATARRWLPYETTQRQLKPSGGEDLTMNGLWIKPLTPGIKAVGPGAPGGRLLLPAGGGELLIGHRLPLDGLEIEARLAAIGAAADGGGAAPERVTVRGAELVGTVLRPDGASVYRLRLGAPRAVHTMWWDWPQAYLYQVALDTSGETALSISVRPAYEGD